MKTDAAMKTEVLSQPVRSRRKRALMVARLVGFAVLAVVVFEVASSHWDELSGAGTYLSRIRPDWVVAAAGAEATSMFAFTALQRRLLGAGGLEVPFPPLVAITLAGNAMANSLPGGGAFASVFAYRQFRRKGADEALATWTLVAVTGLTAVTLAALSATGLAVAGDQGPVPGLLPLLGLLVAGPVAGAAVLLRPRLLSTLVVPPLRLVRRLAGVPRRDPAALMSAYEARIQAVTPRLHDWLIALIWAAGNWTADCTCLACAFLAVGAPVPVRALLLAYGAAQVAANLPVTPGGLGVVEGSLTVALVAFGGSTSATVAAVLLYRILSFWVLLPLGWAVWGGLTVTGRRARSEARR